MNEIVFKSFRVVALVAVRALPILFIVTYLNERGYFKVFDRFAAKVVTKTAFGPSTGKAFMANIGSTYAGAGILLDMFKHGRISRPEMVLSVNFASFPGHIRTLFTSTGPIVFSLFPLPVALFYLLFSLTAGLCKMFIAGFLSHFIIKKEEQNRLQSLYVEVPVKTRNTNGKAVKIALERAFNCALRLIFYVTLVTAAVFYLNEKGIFEKLPLSVSMVGLSEQYNTALYSYIGNAYAGMGIISEFLKQGDVSMVTAIKLLIFCMICSRPIVALKESPSYYLGFFGLRNGLLIMFFNLTVFTGLGLLALLVLSFLH
jgi:hypothetical protein